MSELQKKIGFYTRWLSPEGYLGLHLVIGFILAVFSAYFFAELADKVVISTGNLLNVDERAQSYVQSIASPALTFWMVLVTKAGNPGTLMILSIIVSILLLLQKSHRRLYTFSAIMIGGGLLNWVLKDLFQRNRPTEVAHLVMATGFSFPSGHSMGSMLFYGGLAYVFFFSVKWRRLVRVLCVLLCLSMPILIAFSRVYLGVHYMSDVIAGLTAGLCWIAICVSGTEGWVRLQDYRSRAREKSAGQ